MTIKAVPGEVSSGTLREEDLVPRFLAVLSVLDGVKADRLRREFADVIEHLKTGLEPNAYDLEWFMIHLGDALDDQAPPGHYFGAHEGDGACFGFWEAEQD